jgi:predicted ribonuclease YlaK
MVATEPDFEKTRKWLDPNHEDDRIIASALDLQVRHPADSVILVTSDINLQNKAQAAMLTFADTDDME